MKRILKTGIFPIAPDISDDNALVITSHRAAAFEIGTRYFSLPRLAREILRDKASVTVAPEITARHILKRVIAAQLPRDDTTSIASRIKEILKTVLRIGIDIDTLLEHGSPRVKELAIIAKAYKAELHKDKYIDLEELLLTAASCTPEHRKLLIYGHHRARKEEVLFIDAIAGDGSIYYLPCGDHGIFSANREWANNLIANGWTVDDETAAPETSGQKLAATFLGIPAGTSDISAIAYPNIESEVRGVLSSAKQMIVDGTKPDEIALVCRSQDTYAPVIAAVAFEYGVPVQIAHKIRLADTGFGGLVRLMLDAVDQGFAYESAARLLMHPFGPEISDGVWTNARLHHAAGRDGWAKLGVDLSTMDWPERQPLTAWVGTINAAFKSFGTQRKAAGRAREILAYNKFLETISAFERLEGKRGFSFDQFSALTTEILGEESVPYAPAAGGISLFEPNTILGAGFDHLFVMGMAEGMFPETPSENPVIDFYERKALEKPGIEFEGAADVARWEELSFYFTLLAGRQQIEFSYPMTLDNGERMPNAFFDRLGIKPIKATAELPLISSIEESRTVFLRKQEISTGDAVINDAHRRFLIELARENSPVYDEYDGSISVAIDPSEHKWSASQLTAIGQCSFRWFAQRMLRLEPVDEFEIGLDYTKRGTFYHKVLEIAVSKAKDAADVRQATLVQLEAAFTEAEADPEVDLPTLVNWDLQRGDHISALRKAIEAEDFIKDGSAVVGLEQKFEEDWQGFFLTGYIDRVDNTPDGLIAIDYKTSSTPPKGAKDEEGKLTVDVQIPLYANVALKKLYPEGKLGNSIYYSLVKGKVLRNQKEDDLEKLEGLAERIKKQLAAGDFAVDPDVDEHACAYCRYDPVCRKGPRLQRKKKDQ